MSIASSFKKMYPIPALLLCAFLTLAASQATAAQWVIRSPSGIAIGDCVVTVYSTTAQEQKTLTAGDSWTWTSTSPINKVTGQCRGAWYSYNAPNTYHELVGKNCTGSEGTPPADASCTGKVILKICVYSTSPTARLGFCNMAY